MSRDLTAATQTALTDVVVRPITMLLMELDSGTIAIHSGVGSVTHDGTEYLGVGNFGHISEIQESNDVAPSGVKATLSGIPSEYLSLVIGQHYQGRAAEVYIGLLNEDHTLIVDPALAFRGRVDYADIEIGEVASIVLSIESRLADWERPRIRRYTHEDQQAEFPGDMGLEFVAEMAEKPIVWGV
ncbi:MAG: hypothetical protein L3J57_13990 [Desulfuromusa sp.]|nr:hypothetical protein [Desulfuromusa sp.]